MRGGSLLGGAALVAVAACTASAGTKAPSSSTVVAAPVLECARAIGEVPVPADHTIVVGAVALPAAPAHPALQTNVVGGGEPRLFAKDGLGVRVGVSSEIIVTDSSVLIGWSPPALPAVRVSVPACPAALSRTGWLWFAGGYWTAKPVCAQLTVRSGGREETVRVGVGTPCPGQQAPLGPSAL